MELAWSPAAQGLVDLFETRIVRVSREAPGNVENPAAYASRLTKSTARQDRRPSKSNRCPIHEMHSARALLLNPGSVCGVLK
jgi:hypothetical protein